MNEPPPGPWAVRMTWHDLLFAHWRVEGEAVQSLLPEGLKVETFDGSAWVGVVPFRMSGVRARWAPPLPTARTFPELNVRTYVRGGGRGGVWFFSLDAASRLTVWAARAWFGLPYHHAEISAEGRSKDGEGVQYRSRRAAGGASFEATYGPVGPVVPAAEGTLEHFLVERYRLFSVGRSGRIRCAEVRHEPWPLRAGVAEIRINTMARAAGLDLPDEKPLLHFADRLDVRAWSPRPVDA